MQFESDAQRQCYERVKGLMRQMFGEQAMPNPDAPFLGLTHGSAYLTVGVLARGDHAIVSVVSYPVTDIEPNLELYKYLLRLNAELYFGAFAVDPEDNSIIFSHRLYGDTLDREELEWAIGAVAGTADEQDDEIVKRWGGLRALDRVR